MLDTFLGNVAYFLLTPITFRAFECVGMMGMTDSYLLCCCHLMDDNIGEESFVFGWVEAISGPFWCKMTWVGSDSWLRSQWTWESAAMEEQVLSLSNEKKWACCSETFYWRVTQNRQALDKKSFVVSFMVVFTSRGVFCLLFVLYKKAQTFMEQSICLECKEMWK